MGRMGSWVRWSQNRSRDGIACRCRCESELSPVLTLSYSDHICKEKNHFLLIQ
jgi:hypothetical protein